MPSTLTGPQPPNDDVWRSWTIAVARVSGVCVGCSADVGSAPPPTRARCPQSDSAISTTSFWHSPSPGTSPQSAPPLRSTQAPLHGVVVGHKANLAFSPADFLLQNDDLFSRSYWIPGSYAPVLSEKCNAFSGLLKNKGLKEERKTTVGLDTIDTSTTLDANKSLFSMSWHTSTGPAWPVLRPRAAPGLADALRLLASMGWRLPLALRPASPTTFYPCGLAHPSPDAFCVLRRQLAGQRRRPHLHDGLLSRPCTTTGRLHQHPGRGATPPQPSAYPSLSTAPAGITPVSSKRQSAMSNFRATATIPIRRKRLPPLPKR